MYQLKTIGIGKFIAALCYVYQSSIWSFAILFLPSVGQELLGLLVVFAQRSFIKGTVDLFPTLPLISRSQQLMVVVFETRNENFLSTWLSNHELGIDRTPECGLIF